MHRMPTGDERKRERNKQGRNIEETRRKSKDCETSMERTAQKNVEQRRREREELVVGSVRKWHLLLRLASSPASC